MKRRKLINCLKRQKIAAIIGVILFIISYAVFFTGWHTFGIIGLTGIINKDNRAVLWAFTLLILFICTGKIVDFALNYVYKRKTNKLVDAMQEVTDGNFSVRLKSDGKLTDTGIFAVTSFNDMATQLQETEALHKDFIGNFSHEMKTPLSTINGFAKVLRNNSLTEEEKNECLDIIIDESERLSLLSNNILMLSRLEKLPGPVVKEEYNLTEQIRQSVAASYHKWSEKNIEIVLEGEEVTLSANRELMTQVWLNFLDNAIKFSPENEIVYINVIKNADCITVSIKNHGCTLSGEEIPHIFDKFYQGKGKTKTLGNGIGLSMVRKITELHGGFASAVLCDGDAIAISVSLPDFAQAQLSRAVNPRISF